DFGRQAGLGLADGPYFLGGHAVDPALAGSQERDVDLLAAPAVEADGAAAADRFVIGVRGHHQDQIAHGRSPPHPASLNTRAAILAESKCSRAISRARAECRA